MARNIIFFVFFVHIIEGYEGRHQNNIGPKNARKLGTLLIDTENDKNNIISSTRIATYYMLTHNDTKVNGWERPIVASFDDSRKLCQDFSYKLFAPYQMLEHNRHIPRNAEYWVEADPEKSTTAGKCSVYWFDDPLYDDEGHIPSNEWEHKLVDCQEKKHIICQKIGGIGYFDGYVNAATKFQQNRLVVATYHPAGTLTWETASNVCKEIAFAGNGLYNAASYVVNLGTTTTIESKNLNITHEYWAWRGGTRKHSLETCWYIKYVNNEWQYFTTDCDDRKSFACETIYW